MNNSIILLKTLLLSTSKRNMLKHSKDKKKKRRIIAGFVGMGFIYLMLMAFSIATCVGYGMTGTIDSAPVMCALIISLLSFIFTLLKTNGYLFNFKEYDMLMSLPFSSKSVAACKFLYMYINSLPWYLSISAAMMVGYGIFAKPFFIIYPVWIILSVLLPIIPMLIASFLGFIITRISAGFRKTNIIQTILGFAFMIFCFSLRFIIEGMIKNGEVESALNSMSNVSENAAGVYLPAKWFSDAIIKQDILSMLLLAGVTVVLFVVVFTIVGRSYRNINSALKSHAAAKKFKMSAQKMRSVVTTIAYKEYKRMTGSSTYMINVAFGEVLALLLGIVTLIMGFDRIIGLFTQNAPVNTAVLQPAIPFIIYFFIGMMASTACSPSLEGKNYWIVQSLPIEKKTLYQGKMLFNLFLTVPVMIFSTLCLCISANVPVFNTILYVVLGIILCAFSTAWGCVCGVKHMRIDWENEIEVIKQGTGVTIYLLPNMFVVMALCVVVVILGNYMDHRLVALIFIVIASVLALLSYLRVMALARRK